tara:strand:- start:1594 stop:1980 length:387 start_codon:yes stop_codon:yes gene_type:complete
LLFIIDDKLLTGIKPPEDIKVIDKFKESKDLMSKIFKIMKIINVSEVYKISILDDCFNDSERSKDKKFVNDFLRFVSKISINKIIENKKYKPPIHCDDDLHKIKLSSKCLIFEKIVNPVDVNPDIDSK